MFCFKNNTILESTLLGKEILFKPNFIDGKKKTLLFKDFNYFTRKQELPNLAYFYTTSCERATQIHVIYNQYFLWPYLPIE